MTTYWNVDDGMTSYAYAKVNLEQNYDASKNPFEDSYICYNHYIVMQMDVEKDEHDVDGEFTAQVRYYHQQFVVELSPSVSIGSDGVASFSGVLSVERYMKPLGSVLILEHTWK